MDKYSKSSIVVKSKYGIIIRGSNLLTNYLLLILINFIMKKLLSTLLIVAFIVTGLIFSVKATYAQMEASEPNLIKFTPEQLTELNNLPSVEIRNVSLSKSVYAPGEKVSGSLVLKNDRAYNLPDLKYKISLVGNYLANGLAGTNYDSQFFGPVFLKASEIKDLNFSYLLPSNVAGKGLGIQIQFYTGAGSPLAWRDQLIEVTGVSSVLKVAEAYLAIGEQKYNLQVGPTLSLTKKGTLYIKVENPFATAQVLTPDIKIYDRTVSGKLLESIKLASTTVTAKSSKVFSWEISYLTKPGVYEVSVDFLNKENVKTVPTILARYIVSGAVATIQQVSIDKNILAKKENFAVKITYSGQPMDIDLALASSSVSQVRENILNLTVTVSNEDAKVISTYVNKVDFNKGTTVNIPLVASAPAQKIFLDIKVTDNSGNIIASYLNEVTGNAVVKETAPDNNILYLVGFLFAIILIIVGIFYRKNKGLKAVVIFLAIFFSYSLLAMNSASANSVHWESSWSWNNLYNTQFSLSAPNTLSPGQTFDVGGSITTVTCGNSFQGVLIKRSALVSDSNTVPTVLSNDIQGPSRTTSDAYSVITDQVSLGTFTAPTTPGDYYITLKVTVMWSGGYAAAISEGYIKFTVIAPPSAPTISATTSASCGGNIRLSWPAVIGATSYRVFKNGVALGNVADTSYEPFALVSDLFKVQTYSSVTGLYSVFSNSVSATPSVFCPFTVTATTSPLCGGKVLLNWNSVTNATSYEVHKKNGAGVISDVVTLSSTSHTTNAVTGDSFAVRPIITGVTEANLPFSSFITATPSDLCGECTVDKTLARPGEIVTFTVKHLKEAHRHFWNRYFNNVYLDRFAGSQIIDDYEVFDTTFSTTTETEVVFRVVVSPGPTYTCPTVTISNYASLSATCSAYPVSVVTNQIVNWTTEIDGGNGTYTYAWVGDEFVNGKTMASVSGAYSTSTPSIKHATTTITSGADTVTVGCSNMVTVSGASAIGVCSATVNQCDLGNPANFHTDDITDNNHWDCGGVNGGATTTCSQAPLIDSQDGACGPAATFYSSSDTSYSGALCSHGTANPSSPLFPAIGGSVSWICVDPSNSPTCTASRGTDINITTLSSSCKLIRTDTNGPIVANVTPTSWQASSTPSCPQCTKTWTINNSRFGTTTINNSRLTDFGYILSSYFFGSTGYMTMQVKIEDPGFVVDTCITNPTVGEATSTTVYVGSNLEDASEH